MQKQQQMPSPRKLKASRRKQLPWGRLVIAGIAVLAAIIGIVLGVLDVWGYWHIPNDNLWSTTFLYIIIPILGIVFAFLQWILPIDPRDEEATPSHSTQSASPSSLPAFSISSTSSQQSSSAGANPVQSNGGTVSSTSNIAQPTNSATGVERDFLISYADADKQWAEWIAEELEGAGYSTILRGWDFEPGANFVVEMNDATRRAKRTLLLLSPDYLKGFDEHPEWTVAFSEDKAGRQRKLLPIYVRECKQQVKGLLGPIMPIDIVGKDAAVARDLLLTGVRSGRRRAKQQPGFPGQP